MPYLESQLRLPVLETMRDGRSAWTERFWDREIRGGMSLSPRIDCSSLRLRESKPGYQADWHVAGEAVLIMVRQGVLRIGLRDETWRDFGTGDAFIAADRLHDGVVFDADVHGHTAQVVSELTLKAVHIKLSDFEL